MNDPRRRTVLLSLATTGMSAGCAKPPTTATRLANASEEAKKEEDVSAVEDLMREHGVIRRILVVYRVAAVRLRSKPESVPPDALQKAAELMRSFGEDYHERQLEEAHVFPTVKKAGGPAADQIDTLVAQHARGREITDYVLSTTRSAIAGTAEPLARTLEGFSTMYDEHAAIEDTVIFPAYKHDLSPKKLAEMGELFEQIEKKTFGTDGFEGAVKQIAAVESQLGITLASLSPPPPPSR